MKGKYPLQNLCSNPILCLCSVEEFLCSTLMKWASAVLAERVGFEPTVPFEDNGFRDRPNRPLSHLSVFVSVIRWELVVYSVGAGKNSVRSPDNRLPVYPSLLSHGD